MAASLVSWRIFSFPFRMIPTRWARRATELSWVTRISVRPRSRQRLSRSPMISSLVPLKELCEVAGTLAAPAASPCAVSRA